MKAIILVGGKGTRVKSVSQKLPKCLLEIDKKPVLDYVITCCESSTIINEIIVIAYHDAEQFDHYCNNKKSSIPLRCVKEEQPLGTAGALHSIDLDGEEDVLVIYGDIVCHFDMDLFIKWHRQKKAMMSLVIHPNDHPYDSDLIVCDDNQQVKNVISKPHKEGVYYSNCVNAACYIINTKIKKSIPSNKPSDFGKDILPQVCKTEAVYGYHTTAYLKDMGTKDRIKQVEDDIISGKVLACHESQKRKVVFLDRDGVINEDLSFIKTPEEFKLYPFAASAIQKLNKAGFLVIVVTNQSVIARNLCTIEILRMIHDKMETELGKEGAYIDKIYYCPHHPDEGFPEENRMFKKECECRKPKPGMVMQAEREFNIDISNSFLVGDSERDIQCGIAAGVSTVGVKTGNAVKGKTQPDQMCKNLLDAVDLIIKLSMKEKNR